MCVLVANFLSDSEQVEIIGGIMQFVVLMRIVRKKEDVADLEQATLRFVTHLVDIGLGPSANEIASEQTSKSRGKRIGSRQH